MAHTCLIIERHRSLARLVTRDFPGYGMRPYSVQSSATALNILQQWKFDAALVDADGFGADYVEVLRQLRTCFPSPVVLLSSAQDEHGQLLGLESGATTVVIKPASSRLICANLTRLIEAAGHKVEESDHEIRIGPLLMDAKRGLACVGASQLKLTIQEFELLYLLASRPGEFVDRATIVCKLRGSAQTIGRGTDVHVYRIRRKLKEHDVDALRLDTIYGRGYCLTLQGPSQPEAMSPNIESMFMS